MHRRGSSPTVREGVNIAYETPSLTVGLLPRDSDLPIAAAECSADQENYAEQDVNDVIHLAEH